MSLLKDLLLSEKYDKDHKCKTPGAIYSTEFHSNSITVKVKLPKSINIPDDESEDLESDLHYAIEKVLAKFFK
jgi:hypothetical protein